MLRPFAQATSLKRGLWRAFPANGKLAHFAPKQLISVGFTWVFVIPPLQKPSDVCPEIVNQDPVRNKLIPGPITD